MFWVRTGVIRLIEEKAEGVLHSGLFFTRQGANLELPVAEQGDI